MYTHTYIYKMYYRNYLKNLVLIISDFIKKKKIRIYNFNLETEHIDFCKYYE